MIESEMQSNIWLWKHCNTCTKICTTT